MLVNEYDSIRLYWEWWWSQADLHKLTRPETVSDNDEWLEPTDSKQFVDTETYREYLSEFALKAQSMGALRRGPKIQRSGYREDLINYARKYATRTAVRTVVMTGGGYGAGKTTVMDLMVRSGIPGIALGSVTGVDYFKAYLPEFSLLQLLADGRASSIVQAESRALASSTFGAIIADGCSFGWDSSMSNKSESMARIEAARAQGYRLKFVAVFAPVERAIVQAMERARKSKRFAHPDFLRKSHQDFAAHFMEYVPHFDEIHVFANEDRGTLPPNPVLIASKGEPNRELAIHDQRRFVQFVS